MKGYFICRERGSITVYLALILLVILSLFFTIIEGARVSTAKVYAERALSTAMDSVWAEYYGPLWEEYHIFGYHTVDGSDTEKAQQMEDKLTEYMSYTFEPNKDLGQGRQEGEFELYDISLDAVAVDQQTKLMDYQGELLINQAVEYMKYNEVAGGLELLLNKFSLLETPKKVSAVYEDKIAAEEELVEIDKSLLKLMELLDGIKTSKRGIELDNEGKLQTNEYFVKKICCETVTRDLVGINNEMVFLAVRDRYINPLFILNQGKGDAAQLDQIKNRFKEINERLKENSSEIESAQAQLQAVSSGDKKSKDVKAQIKAIGETIRGLYENRNSLQEEGNELAKLKEQRTSSARASMNNILLVIQKLKPLLEDAMAAAETITYTANSVDYLIDDFEESLYGEKESLGEDIFAELEESLMKMKNYTTSYNEEEGFYDMIDILDTNLNILVSTEEYLHQGLSFLESENYQALTGSINDASSRLQLYDIRSLSLDYSTLVLDNTKQKNPIDEIGSILEQGLTGLVIDPKNISKKELMQEQLPSVEAALLQENTDFVAMITEFFENSVIGSEDTGMQSLLYDFSDTTQLMADIEDGINTISEHLLYQEYLKEHFENYPTEGKEVSTRKPAALIYEQEYLLVGKRSDQENIASVIGRIIFLRMILDFVTILGDRAKCEEARLAATALVGFTGLPILISITQTVLLLVWSFAEALVDTCALLMGKEVPVIKKQTVLQFPEMFLLNRSFLQKKASQTIDTKQMSFSYQDYLRMFLLMKNKEDLVYRSMDLMQENINLRYAEEFHIRNCLYGFEAEADYIVKTKFMAIPFVSKYLNRDVSSFKFSKKAVYCY